MRRTAAILALLVAGAAGVLAAQEASSSSARKGGRAAEQRFLLFGTVFTPQGYSLPGARVEVRRAGEKRVRWRATSDARGEFAVRVPPGAEYEVTVKARNFATATRKVDATSGVQEDMVFRMTAAPGGTK